MKMLLYTLALIYLANTCVTGLVLKPNCTLQTFSCPCGQSRRFGTTGLGGVSVSSCVTNGSQSKDVCSSEAARAKCHEIQVKQAHRPFIESFGLQENNIAFIGSQINLTCKMKNTQVAIFLKSGVAVREGGRYKYMHVHSAHKRLDSYLEITNVTKDDDGNYTCFAYKNGILTSAKYTLRTVPCPAGYFCPLFSNKALLCEAGTYREQSSNMTHKCTPCPKPLALQGGWKTGAKSVNDCFTGTVEHHKTRRESLETLFR